ncbi:MAG TPA: DUF6544 family protein [Allosphingosinicella sp.]|jgi:hypothetical protein
MSPFRIAAVAVPSIALGLGAVGYRRARASLADAEAAWQKIAAASRPASAAFHPDMVAELPEIARRYFAHAIAPGTPLRTTVELEMRGTFLLGDRSGYQSYAMTARQILAPPKAFVWIPQMRSGAMRISGSDALVGTEAWTRFWLLGVIPVANARSSPDLLRSATFRSAMEGVWAPASLLPQQGVTWEQSGADSARVTVRSVTPEIVLELTLASDGAVRTVAGQRWSNANPEGSFRLQPFGGTVEGEATFGGYTIPGRLKVGNHYGTGDYLPFFQAEIVRARYL